MSALDLLSGDAQAFLDKVWASQVHVHHRDPEALVRLLRLEDVDSLLTSTAIRAPAVRLAQDGAVLGSGAYTRQATLAGSPLTGLVDARKVLDLFEQGATVVLQGLHRYWPPLTRLVRDLEVELGHPCQANAYLTPPGSQGFSVHSDSHDVFVFQTHGRKLWEVHEEGAVREVLLEPGVSMYLPTGTPHAARAQESASLHVTLGLNQVTWRQLLRSVADDVLASDEYAAHLPAGYVEEPETLTRPLADRLAALASALAGTDPAAAVANQTRRFLTGRPAAVPGGLTDRLGLDALGDDTVVSRRPGSVCVLRGSGDRLTLLLGDRALDVPARLREPIEHLRGLDAFRPADLAAWLDPQSRVVLVRRLVREGLLRIGG